MKPNVVFCSVVRSSLLLVSQNEFGRSALWLLTEGNLKSQSQASVNMALLSFTGDGVCLYDFALMRPAATPWTEGVAHHWPNDHGDTFILIYIEGIECL